jgi:adenylosuccinate lyase
MVRTGLDPAEYHTAARRVILLAGELQDAIADLREVAQRQAVPSVLGPVGAGYAARMAAVTAWILQDWRKAEPDSFAMHPQPCGASMATTKKGQTDK